MVAAQARICGARAQYGWAQRAHRDAASASSPAEESCVCVVRLRLLYCRRGACCV